MCVSAFDISPVRALSLDQTGPVCVCVSVCVYVCVCVSVCVHIIAQL
jgi:hypothetical protein